MMITNILLGLLVLTGFYRIYAIYKKPSKKTYFKIKTSGAQKLIWDLEFKKFKTAEIREQIRKEYDYMKSRIEGFETKKKTEKDKGEKARIDDVMTLAIRDKDRLELQIKKLDVEINGAEKSKDYPDGTDGMVQNIESLEELVGMLKDWVKNL